MESTLIHQDAYGQRTFVVILHTGDEVIECLMIISRKQNLSACQITAIGAFREALLGYFDIDKKDYRPIPAKEQVEVLVMAGDITLSDNKPEIHAHVVVGRKDGSAKGGHLLKAYVRPTLEIILTESPAHLYRKYDEEAGVALIKI